MVPVGLCAGCFGIVFESLSLVRSGGDLLSHVLRRSTIGAAALIGRVRDGIGSFACAMTTRPDQGQSLLLQGKHQCCSKSFVLLTIQGIGACRALLFLDQIKPIEQLVPVS